MTASRGTRYFLRGHCLSDVILFLEPPAGNSVESSQRVKQLGNDWDDLIKELFCILALIADISYFPDYIL